MYDSETWTLYPQYRLFHNKLYVSELFDIPAGPNTVPPPVEGKYCIRPIYNLYGMGWGAKVQTITKEDFVSIKQWGHIIPPGYFWQQYLEGTHYSTDYRKNTNNQWEPFCSMTAEYGPDLIQFKSWTKTHNPPTINLPSIINDINVPILNIESKDNKPIEIHLRPGNELMWSDNVNKLIPVWNSNEPISVSETEQIGKHYRYGFRIE